MDREQLRKQLDGCKKSFVEAKYSDGHKSLQKLLKDCGDSRLASAGKLRLTSLILELHKNKFYGLENFSQLVNSVEKSVKNGTSLSLLGVDIYDESSIVFVYNCCLFLFYTQQYEITKLLMSSVLAKSSESDIKPEEVSSNWGKIMDHAKWDQAMKFNLSLIWCEISIKLWESNMSTSMEKETGQVINWLESKLMTEKTNPNSKDAKNYLERWQNRLSILKNNVLLTENNLKNCKKEMRSLPTPTGSNASQAVPAIFIRAKFEYLRKHYIKSMKLLNFQHYKSHSETGESIPMMYYNNLACIHYQNGKNALGVFYARKAFAELEKIEQQASKGGKKITASSNNGTGTIASTSQLHTVSAMRTYELHFNMGVHLLAAKMPEKAFEEFFNAVQFYYDNPKLWLKLSECCVALNVSKARPIWTCAANGENDSDRTERESVVLTSLGSGPNHKLLVRFPGMEGSAGGNEEDVQSAAFPAASLGFGALCVENTLLLANKQKTSQNLAKTNEVIIQALTIGAYINLCLGDYLKSINYCDRATALIGQTQKEQQQTDHHLMHILLLYKSEAMVNMNQVNNAVEMLTLQSNQNVFMIKKKSTENDISEKESYASIDKWVAYMLTMGSIYAMKGNYDECKKLIQMVAVNLTSLQKPLPTECYMLAAYIELCYNNHALAVEIIKRKQIPSYDNLPYNNNKSSTTFVGATAT